MENHNSAVGVYVNHEHAALALKQLTKVGLDSKQISVLGKADIIDGKVNAFSADKSVDRPAKIGAVIGPILGLLSGVGIATIPGFGMVYGAGAIVGAIAGFDLGIIGGGLVSLLLTFGISKEEIITYQNHIEEGKHLIIFHGKRKEIMKAQEVMEKGTALLVGAHY